MSDAEKKEVQTPVEMPAEPYCIHWKNKLTGQSGRGTKKLPRAEAFLLAQELNEDYPDMAHEAVPA